MISDTLSDAADELEHYLTDATFSGAYTEEIRAKVRALQSQMRALATQLDTPSGRGDGQLSSTFVTDPRAQHLIRWLSPFVARNADDFNTTWSFVLSDVVTKASDKAPGPDLIAAYDVICAIRAEAGILDS